MACCSGCSSAAALTVDVPVQDGTAAGGTDVEAGHDNFQSQEKGETQQDGNCADSSNAAPGCCEQGKSPCCDSTCMDRLALRECQNSNSATSSFKDAKGTDQSNTGVDCQQGRDGKPCSLHSRSVRERYQAKLEALGCICRALLARGQESCCAPRERSTAVRKRPSSELAHSRGPTTSKAGCVKTRGSTESRNKEARDISTLRADANSSSDPCCSKSKNPATNTSRTVVRCADDICDPVQDPTTATSSNFAQAPALEKGLPDTQWVVLSVSGMTCAGCETKLKRVLAALDSVYNIKSSLVLARAEFDLDTRTGSVTEVVKQLERNTEFRFERIDTRGSSIDILCPDLSVDVVSLPWPKGVTDMKARGEGIVHVEFDAKEIGSRTLLEKGWDTPMSLAPIRPDPTLDATSKHVRHVGFMTLLSAILTIPVLVMSWAPLPENEIAYGSASLALATIIQFAIAGPFYPKALKALIFSKMIEMDLLIVLSTSAAYVFSVVAFGYLVSGKPLSTGEFFETSTLLVTLIMVGRYVAAFARQKAVETISIRSLQTPTATLLDQEGNEKQIDIRLLEFGDIFKVVPDSRLPTDGTVISGSSEIDESMVTGESKPVEKYPGSSVIAGSINGSGTLHVRLTRLPGDNTISTIAGMVDEAKLSKPKIQDVADRVASYFVPVVVGLTVVTFVIWVAVGVGVQNRSGADAVTQALTYAITVLIVSCPCAIGLAVPMVIVIASGVAAEKGVVFQSADTIEIAYKTSHVVLDKTGTLTQGKLTVSQEEYFDYEPGSVKSLILGLLDGIKHPVSTTIAAHLKADGVQPSPVADTKSLTGKGVEGFAFGQILHGGNSRWLGFSSNPRIQGILSNGHTAFCFTIDGVLAAAFGLEDSLRPDAVSTVSTLQSAGVAVHILSGDDDGAVQSVASRLSVPEGQVRSRCSPADKQAYIQDLLTRAASGGPVKGEKRPVVTFCGDGTNDAVALAQATIGVHMNQGTDVAKSAADVVLMRPALAGIVTMISISKKSIHRIAFNFGWSFVYNLFAVLLGSGAFVHARIPPEFAGLGELVSVLPVIAAAVMLRWARI